MTTKDSEVWNDIGVPAIVEDEACGLICGSHLALLRPFLKSVDCGYLFRALQSTGIAYQFHTEANGITRYGLSHGAIKSVWAPLPSLPEQAAIVQFLETQTVHIATAIDSAHREVVRLCEYRTRLIADVVSGKLDMREAAVPLPKEAAPEIIDDITNMDDETESPDMEV